MATWERELDPLADRVRLTRHEIDVLCLQESKARDDQFSTARPGSATRSPTTASNQWNGGAIRPASVFDDEVGFDGAPAWERRHRGCPRGGHRRRGLAVGSRWSVYVPTVARSRTRTWTYKVDWLVDCSTRPAAGRPATCPWPCVATGTSRPSTRTWSMAFYEDKSHVSPREQAAFHAFLDAGFVDVAAARARAGRSTPIGTTSSCASRRAAACGSTSSRLACLRSPRRGCGAIDREERRRRRERPRSGRRPTLATLMTVRSAGTHRVGGPRGAPAAGARGRPEHDPVVAHRGHGPRLTLTHAAWRPVPEELLHHRAVRVVTYGPTRPRGFDHGRPRRRPSGCSAMTC